MADNQIKVILDANVLFPFTLRDTLLRSAEEGFFDLYWTEKILDEVIHSLVKSGKMTDSKAGRLRKVMLDGFLGSMVTDFEFLIDKMPNHPKDRHVTAAAVMANIPLIITMNLKDFKILPGNIKAQSPDEFLSNLFKLKPDVMVNLLRNQAEYLKNPPVTLSNLLNGLKKSVPNFAKAVARHARIDLS